MVKENKLKKLVDSAVDANFTLPRFERRRSDNVSEDSVVSDVSSSSGDEIKSSAMLSDQHVGDESHKREEGDVKNGEFAKELYKIAETQFKAAEVAYERHSENLRDVEREYHSFLKGSAIFAGSLAVGILIIMFAQPIFGSYSGYSLLCSGAFFAGAVVKGFELDSKLPDVFVNLQRSKESFSNASLDFNNARNNLKEFGDGMFSDKDKFQVIEERRKAASSEVASVEK